MDLEIEDESEDVYSRTENPDEIHIKTHYEKLDIAETNKVYYIRFRLPEEKIPQSHLKLQELLKQIENNELRNMPANKKIPSSSVNKIRNQNKSADKKPNQFYCGNRRFTFSGK